MVEGLAGKTAIVSGGSRGIGRSIVLELAKSGVRVAFSFASQESAAQEVAARARELGGEAMPLKADMRNESQVKEFVEKAKAKLGKVDFLVNNAGITRDKAMAMMSTADWKDVLETNLDGTYYLTRQLVFGFIKQKSGAIVNVSSVTGVIGNAGQTNYAASKAGIIGLTKSLAKEVAAFGIRVNAVAPGFIKTDMVAAMPDEKMNQAELQIPMKRFGQSEEIARVVLFLLSDAASYITGEVISIDGGLAI